MKTFKVYIQEKIKLPSKSTTLGIDRKEMPQIDSKYRLDFIKYLKDKKIKTADVKLTPGTLKATQHQFHTAKIQSLIDKIEDGSYDKKPILVSKDNYVMDGHHRWLAYRNLGMQIPITRVDVTAKELIDLMHDYPKSYKKKLYEESNEEADYFISEDSGEMCAIISKEQMKAFEKFVDRMFEKFGLDFNFTNHFRDRMGDNRNKPCIDIKELANLIKKIYAKQGKSIKGVAGAEAVLKDIQSDLNIPVAVKYDSKNDDFDVAMKTVMRKKNFRSPDKSIAY